MPLIERLTPDFVFGDERGKLVQLVREGYRQVNVVASKAGYKRGGHYHKQNREAFYIISGGFDFTARRDGTEEHCHFQAGDMFLVPPGVAHDFYYTEDTVLVSMYDKGVELSETEKDIYQG